ncbi:MAG TPA: HAD family phosphatase [Ramlibacter sp.]
MSERFDAVLFDCDGVLVDSEGITHQVLRGMLADLGWDLTQEESMRIFLGKAVKDERALIESMTGRALTEEWLVRFRERRNEALLASVQPVRHAVAAVEAISRRFSGRIACCSGADRWKVEMQLAKCGLLPFFDGRVFSGHELPRSKPFPDVYLAAMEPLGARPERCLVVEDTVTGVTAGVRAGCEVWGYSPPEAGHDTPRALEAAGASRIFADMADLPALVG